MNIYFSGIGGVGIGPLAEIAEDAGHHVQGSDQLDSPTTKRLSERGVAISRNQMGIFLQSCHDAQPIDWFVYSSALSPNHPELTMARMLGIKTSKRDGFLTTLLEETNLKMIAIAGTHGKTGTTSLFVWAMQQLGVPISYSIGSTLAFGPSGKYDPESQYFIYECDEYDRNFLQFHPHLSLITSLDYDHPDTYGSPEEYADAFQQFISQSEATIMWQHDGALLVAPNSWQLHDNETIDFALSGEHTRRNATLVLKALERLDIQGNRREAIESFPGVDRRFEKLAENLYSDYGHHPAEIAATLQMAREVADHVVLVYQPHQNVRQHEIRLQYTDCFELADTVYWLPTYLSREDPNLPILTAEDLTENVTNIDSIYTADTDEELWEAVQRARDDGKLVLFMGAGSIDEWVREKATTPTTVKLLLLDQEGNFIFRTEGSTYDLFGGHVKKSDHSHVAAAAHMLHSQTGIHSSTEDLAYFKTFLNTNEESGANEYIVYYSFTGIDSADIKTHHDTHFEKISPNDLGGHSLPIQIRTVITEYSHPPLLYT